MSFVKSFLKKACLILALFLVVCISYNKVKAKDGIWTGCGENDNPYLIEDADDFLEFREYVNSGRSTENRYFLLKGDIDLSELCGENVGSWTPIGTLEHPFKGHFSGEGNKVLNLYISEGDRTGLFGVNNGYIENVELHGSVAGGESVGGIVGENFLSVSNCKSHVTVSGSNRVGGITGCNYGFIFNCYNHGSVSGSGEEIGGIAGLSEDFIDYCTNAANITGAAKVGGIAGRSKSNVQDCLNADGYVVSAIGEENDYDQARELCVGGIVGLSESSVKNCTNKAKIECAKNTAGGIVGKITCELIYNCINEGEISGGGILGGIAGCFRGREDRNNNNIANCTNKGNVTGTETAVGGIVGDSSFCDLKECINKGSVAGTQCTGGIAGKAAAFSVIDSITNAGKVSGDDYTGGIIGFADKKGNICNCLNTGEVEGKNCTGGILGGTNDSAEDYLPGEIRQCTNTATVTGNIVTGGIAGQCGKSVYDSFNKGTVEGTHEVGGIAGKLLNKTGLENNLNTGNISGTEEFVGGIAGANTNSPIRKCRNEGRVEGSFYVGGIVGENYGGTDEARGVIEQCLNYGEIKTAKGYFIGGIAGSCSLTDITGCENKETVSSSEGYYTGGIVGEGVCVKIQRCGNTGTVISKQKYVGGIAGMIKNSEIENCFDRGMVCGGYDVGGIVGRVTGGNNLIAKCYTKAGTNKIIRDKDSENGCVGALYGKKNEGTIVTMEFCYWWRSCAQKARGDIEGADESVPSLGFTAYNDERWFGIPSKFETWEFGTVWYIYDAVPSLMLSNDVNVSESLGCSAEEGITGGEGNHTANVCYINSVEDFEAFRDMVNSGNNYSGGAVFLCEDLNLGGDNGMIWNPVGESLPLQFEGIFYGGNHVIKGLLVSDADCAGLFGCCAGTIRDLAVTGTVSGNGTYTGGIAGYSSGRIKNCFFLGDVSGKRNNSFAGGIAGYATGHCELKNCGHVGNVTVASGYAGGVVGIQHRPNVIVSRCFHYNKLNPHTNVVCQGSGKAGSVAGEAVNPSNITECYALSGCCNSCIGYIADSTQLNVSGGVMLVEEAFRRPESFDGWDIDSDGNSEWVMGQDYPLPRNLGDYIVLSPNGAEGEEIKLRAISGQFTAPKAVYSRQGYFFICWNDKQDGSGTDYYEGDEVPGGITLYARWFNGTAYQRYIPIEPENSDYTGLENQTYNLLLDGNTDTKWCLSLSDSNDTWTLEFQTKDYVRPCGYALVTAGDTKMYPGRNPKNWKLEAREPGGQWVVLDEVTNDATLPPRNFCTVYKALNNNMEYCRFRISFSGLTSGNVFQLSEFYLITKDPEKDVRQAKITLHANDKIEGAATKREYLYGDIGSTTYIPGDPFNEQCYELLYWTENPIGSGSVYMFGDPFIIECDTTIYAQWRIRDFQLVVKRDADEEPPYFRNYWTYNADRPFKLTPPRREGYLFQYWIVTSEAGNWKLGTTYDKDTLFYGMYGNAELVGIWKELKEVSVKWYCGSKLMDEGTYYEGDTPTYNGENPEKESDPEYDYVFKGWDKEIKPLTGDTTFHAEFNENRRYYDITWLNENGEQIDVTSVAYGTVPTHEDLGKLPTRESCFIFDGWDETPVAVTGKATYKAKFREIPRPYEITWQYDDGTVIDVTEVDYGTVPSHAEAEMKPTDEYTYTFAGWDRQPIVVDGPAVYTATFTATKNSYEITWKNDLGEVIDVTTVEYGTVPTHEDLGKLPTRESCFVFAGWDETPVAVTGKATYKAKFTEIPRKYEIIWRYENGLVIDNSEVEYGTVPSIDDPSMESTAEFTYTFAGWDPEVTAVDGPTVYTAKFTATRNSYEITWKNDLGEVIDVTTVEYGTVPTHADPETKSTAEYTYTFAGWSPELTAVDGPAVYTATYTASKNSYEITWKNDLGEVIDVTTVEYGIVPTHDDLEKKETRKNYFVFAGWDKTPEAVTGNATYTAVFTEIPRPYEITWRYDDGTVIDVTEVDYGTVPSHAEAEMMPTDEFTYTFAGWDPEVTAVDGPTVYTAQFTATRNSYEITWKNDLGEVIDVTTVEYGTVPTHEDIEKLPTKESCFIFAGWDKTPEAVTGDAIYTAKFTEIPRPYEITWRYENGTVIDVTTEDYGTVPSHADPSMERTAEFTYTFAGWDPEVTAVDGPAVYTAKFTAVRNSYEITWKNDKGEVIDITVEEYGKVPSHADPVKESIPEFEYTFKGWSPEVKTVTGKAEYTVQFSESRRSYTVRFEMNGAPAINDATVEYGSSVEKPDEPVFDGHVFEGWFADAELKVLYTFNEKIEGETTVYASWTEIQPAPSLKDNEKPVANDNLTETGKAQALITAPKIVPEGYTVEYSLDGENWSAEIPCGTKSGNYVVRTFYRADQYHTDFYGEVLSVEIKGVYNTDVSTSEWTRDSGKALEFRISKEYDDEECLAKFTGITVDGKTAEQNKDFSVSVETKLITVNDEYMETLELGEHTIKALFEDGEVTLVINIVEAKSAFPGKLLLWIIPAAIALAGAVVALIAVKRKHS